MLFTPFLTGGAYHSVCPKRGSRIITMRKLITDAKAIGTGISAFRKSYATLMEEGHVLAVSVLAYTAKAGRTDLLNDFYAGLTVAHQGAFKQYVGKHMGGQDKSKHFLEFAQSRFTLIVDRQKQRDAFAKIVDKLLEGGQGFEPFFNKIALDRSADVFTNENVFTGIDRLIKRATGDDSTVSQPIKDTLLAFRKALEDERAKLEKAANSKAVANKIIAEKAGKPAPKAPANVNAKPASEGLTAAN